MKKEITILSLAIVFLFLTGCNENVLQAQTEELQQPPVVLAHEQTAVPSTQQDNPIDRAFARVLSEHKYELEDNAIFAYIHALKWRSELENLRAETNNELIFKIDSNDMLSAAYEYGKSRADSEGLSAHFEGIARFYKLLVFDCLEQLKTQGLNKSIQQQEDEIYRYLNSVNYDGHFDSDSFDIVSWYELEYNNDIINPNPMPALAGLPDEGIFFHYSEFGAVLTVKGTQHLYLWNYMTPRLIMPRLALSDFNNDGTDELAVILYNGSGTGVSIEELHIVDLQYFSDIAVTIRDIEYKLNNRFSASYERDAKVITVKYDEQTLNVDVSKIMEDEINLESAGFSGIIGFSAAENRLSVNVAIGLYNSGQFTPFEYIDFHADIMFDEIFNISLSNCRIEYHQ